MKQDDFDFDVVLPAWVSVAIIVGVIGIFCLSIIGLAALIKSG